MKKRQFKAPSGANISLTELGLGTAPLGNLFRAIPDQDANATLDAAWAKGIRYFDTAPFYGLGLAEARLNPFLRGKRREDYVISTKVGRLLDLCQPKERAAIGRFFATPSRKERFDYSHDGIWRSLEFSLERLGLDRIDILLVHDIDIFTHGTAAARDAHVKTLMRSGYKALIKLREQGVVKAIGAGINESEVAHTLLQRGDFDLFLLASRYTLLEHEKPLNRFLPLCEKRGVGIIIGGPYNSGILVTGAKPGARYDYDRAPKAILDRVRKIEAVCARYKVKLPQAALQFPMAHPCVVSIIPGAVSPTEVARNIETLSAKIPKAFWKALKEEGLLDRRAPHP